MPQTAELVTVMQPKKAAITAGTAARLTFAPEEAHLFTQGGKRIQ